MSAFKQLKDVSNNFEQQLRIASVELFSAKVGETFEDGIGKKMQDLTFLTSKLRLLKAKPIAESRQIADQPHSEDIIKEYGDVAMFKVLEQTIVKSLTQAHAVKTLIITADGRLDPDMVERKENIIRALKEYEDLESILRQLHSIEQAKQEKIAAVRKEWDEELTRLRELQGKRTSHLEESEISGPLYNKLHALVDKMEMMRWLVCRLVTPRCDYDWLAAPSRTARALRLARTPNTIDSFVNVD